MKTGVCILFLAGSAFAVDFDREIRPLLTEHCVECHGQKKQKGELRLDAKLFAMKGGHDGPAIVAGNTATSPLIQRITSTNEDERMPPKGEPLSALQIEKLKQWIESGAIWPENEADKAAAVDKRLQHWSLQPLRKSFGRLNSIDDFISASLSEKGLTISPEADRRTLIRRLSFDLTGLPPPPERVEQFTNDTDPQAYAKLVDELLNSPHYGERWARHWLDIAHYADTHGFERDQIRPNAWRYRDYVIAALNEDKPYQHFLREQIAGDVIAPNDAQSLIATGFLAAGPWDFVGNVETKSDMLKRAARAGDLDDMVTQVITSTMGITINCARCHDHKLDPITQKEYYSLWAVFAGVKRGEREVNSAESNRLREEKQRLQAQLAATNAEAARLSGEGLDLADIVGGGDGHGTGTKGSGIVLETGEVTTKKLGMHNNVRPNALRAPMIGGVKPKPTPFIKGVFLPNGGNDGDGTIKLAEDVLLKDIPRTSGLSWDAVRNGTLNAQVHAKINGTDYQSAGHTVLGLHANSGITFDLEAIRKANGLGELQLTAAAGIGAAPNAASSKADFAIYLDAERKVHRAGLKKTESVSVDLVIPASVKFITLMATDGQDGIGSDLLFLGDAHLRPAVHQSTLTEAEKSNLENLKAESTRLQKAITAVPEPPQVYAVKSEEKPPVVHVQLRGNPEDEGEEVTPAAFSWSKHAAVELGTNASIEGERRRALAEWITHPENPLTRRVLVNRLWHHHFGQGLVTTPSDFGLGGDRPSHPELLDWLAEEFLKSGWSLKPMHKLIVMSAAYRQRSSTGGNGESGVPEKSPLPRLSPVQIDSNNRLLWRQNPRRLDAESLHDAVLAVSGRLNPSMGGPGYRDFKYTEAYAPIYEYQTPDNPDLWRRSIYRFIVRTTPHQFMSTLDCPDPANLTPARVNTTTALQALTLSNNEFMLQQAQHLAARIDNETRSREAAIRRAFTLVFQRDATPAELRAATSLVASQGLFALCRMLMNANEFVYLD